MLRRAGGVSERLVTDNLATNLGIFPIISRQITAVPCSHQITLDFSPLCIKQYFFFGTQEPEEHHPI